MKVMEGAGGVTFASGAFLLRPDDPLGTSPAWGAPDSRPTGTRTTSGAAARPVRAWGAVYQIACGNTRQNIFKSHFVHDEYIFKSHFNRGEYIIKSHSNMHSNTFESHFKSGNCHVKRRPESIRGSPFGRELTNRRGRTRPRQWTGPLTEPVPALRRTVAPPGR